MKYGYRDGNAAIATKGPAQHIPFRAFAPVDHFTLFFILSPIEDINLRDLPKIIPKVIPKLRIEMMA
jgi:hypothetical protein